MFDTRDRRGEPITLGDLVMVPTPDYIPGKGHCYTFGIGTVTAIFKSTRGPAVRVHSKYETYSVLAKRCIGFTE